MCAPCPHTREDVCASRDGMCVCMGVVFQRRCSSPLGPHVREFPCVQELLFQGSLPPLGWSVVLILLDSQYSLLIKKNLKFLN